MDNFTWRSWLNLPHLSTEAPGFRACFPIFSWLVFHPHITAVAALFAAAIAFLGSSPLIACGTVCLWTGLFSFCLESKVLERILFPPFTAVMTWGALGTGVGIPIMYASPYFSEFYKVYDVGDWQGVLMAAQVAYLLAFPFAWLGYWSFGFRKVEPITAGDASQISTARSQSGLVCLAWILLLAAILLMAGKTMSGLDDRSVLAHSGSALPAAVAIPLKILPKFGMMGFVFAPFLWSRSRISGKFAVGILLLVYVAMALASGSRGLLLYMGVFVFAGCYLFRRKNSRIFEVSLIVLALVSAILTSLLLSYRLSDNFHRTTSRAVMERLRILIEPETLRTAFYWSPEGIYRFGYSLLTVDDHIVFALTPGKVPYAGLSGFSAVLWTWIPTTLAPGKKPLLDAEIVTGAYEMPPVEKKTGAGISLAADAWRRFGWGGIPPSMAIAFCLYGLLARCCFAVWRTGGMLGWGFLVFLMMYFWSRPFGTVLGTWWGFLYDTPKHLAAITGLCLTVALLHRSIHPESDNSKNIS